MADLEQIAEKVEAGDADSVESLTEQAVNDKIPAGEILSDGLIKGMLSIGVKFKNNEVYIPEVLIAARAMKAGMEIIKPLLGEADIKSEGKVVLGTVKGDLHDIGKNIVSIMLEGAGFEVVDLGIDVPKEKFLEAAEKENADIVAISALLTTTMTYMKEVTEVIKGSGIKDKVKVIVGGAPITQEYANEIGADGYAADAATAVDVVKQLLQ